MKHLKLFENVYEELPINYDWNDPSPFFLRTIPIEDRYIKSLLSLIKDSGISSGSMKGKVISIRNENFISPRRLFEIYQMNDEWFYVISKDSRFSVNSYKCDQFEGVIQLLKDKGII